MQPEGGRAGPSCKGMWGSIFLQYWFSRAVTWHACYPLDYERGDMRRAVVASTAVEFDRQNRGVRGGRPKGQCQGLVRAPISTTAVPFQLRVGTRVTLSKWSVALCAVWRYRVRWLFGNLIIGQADGWVHGHGKVEFGPRSLQALDGCDCALVHTLPDHL